MLDEEIEKKSSFTKMLEAARIFVSKQEPQEAKISKDDEEESIVLNKGSQEGDIEANCRLKSEDPECEDEDEF